MPYSIIKNGVHKKHFFFAAGVSHAATQCPTGSDVKVSELQIQFLGKFRKNRS